ncbi:Methyltransferase domain-containing protein [Noviherbaspirillum humi]|uniref:Methyltransferase domain-containing protein n=1 Tax=Noviherbaspirillum humi TaxID=1688639 RepID=A0A239LYC0_9BURK|nr:methyltransferase domain-containing protein [Noviherbaspirillum humi]SNT35345.1 Methyltransferase domain-containing protein [Noviherbaspirillum humi]
MNQHAIDKRFAGSIPKLYDQYLVPLIFAPYALDLAHRLRKRPMRRLLEVAAGTGAVTRALDEALPPDVSMTITDLNQAMLDQAAASGTARKVEWRQADALDLPFGDAGFDVVVCQFGAMFFPDKERAYAEAWRVLNPDGLLLFNVWDRIEENEFACTITEALAALFPEDPPRFLARTPHGYADPGVIARDLKAAGVDAPARIDTVAARSRAASPEMPAIAYCQGTPLRSEIEAFGPDRLAEATAACKDALARRFGQGAVDGKIQAHVIAVEKAG